jgi:hypothetical protein
MGVGRTAGRLFALAACGAIAGAPFACGAAFSAGGGDAGAPDGSGDAPFDGPASGDGATAESSSGGGDASGGESGIGDASGATVQGTVVDAYLQPMSGLDVHCQGQKATTGADGTFTMTGIAKPYTATVVAPQFSGRKHGYVFENVSRLDPTLQLAADQAHPPSATTTVGGTMSTNATTASGIVFADFPSATPSTASPTIPIVLGASSYSGSLSWGGSETASPTLYVLQWIMGSGGPSAYIAYNSAPQALTGGTPHTWNPAVSVTVSQGQMTVGVMPSSGYVPVDIGVFLRPPGAIVAAPIQHGVNGSLGKVSVNTPDIPGATFVACGLQVQTGFDGGPGAPFGYACATALSNNDSPVLQPPQATTFVTPPPTARAGTPFTYQGIPGGLYFVAFTPVGSAAATSDALFVVTSSTQATVPDLSLLAFVLQTGDTLTAEAFGVAPFGNIDAALGPTGFSEYLNDYRLDVGATASGALAYSGPAVFTVE